MCGIFGIVKFDGSAVSSSLLSRMGTQMVHRGPDGFGEYINGSVGLAMQRLAIIDVDGGQQPIANEDGSIQVICNGEIYNYVELRADLEALGHEFATHSDVEVILHLYEEYGTDAVQHLNGMFAFALFDQNNDLLWIARDRLGIKPLYYCQQEHQFVFSSTLDSALVATGPLPLDQQSLARFLAFSYIPAPWSAYQSIYKLMPGEMMVLHGQSAEFSRYWCLPDIEPETDENRAAVALANDLADATRLEMRSDVPLGVFLSGGVDSSAVAALACQSDLVEPLQTFTVDFTDKGGEDLAFANIVSQHIKSKHHVISVTPQQQFDCLAEIMPKLDEPMSDSAIVPTYILAKAAADKGIKVLLSGAGGDEIFAGYPRHFPGAVGSPSWFASLPLLLRFISFPFWWFINKNWAWRFLHPGHNFGIMIAGTYLPFLREALLDPSMVKDIRRFYKNSFAKAGSSDVYDLLKLDLHNYLPNNVLALTDKATMAASVEGRVPLLDHRLVEATFRLPARINVLGGEPKGLFKAAVRSLLPSSLFDRKKEGFNAPIIQWVQANQAIIREELLTNTAQEMLELVDMNVVETWLSDQRKRKRGGETLYALYVLNMWLRTRTPVQAVV